MNKALKFSSLYEKVIQPVLKNDQGIDAEYLTNSSLNLLGLASKARNLPIFSNIMKNIHEEFCIEDDRLNQKICGIDFCNPLGLAAGFDKNGVAANIWRDFGFGYAEIGTVTQFAQPGNPKPRLFRLAKEQAALNRMGFNNNGAYKLQKTLIKQRIGPKEERQNICLGINFGKSKITPLLRAKEDYIYSMKMLIPYCDYATINVSSPNTKGLRKLQEPDLLKDLIREVKMLPNCPPIFIKISPDLNFDEIDNICQLINDEKINGIIATNTSLDRLGLEDRSINQTGKTLSQEDGGLSGKPLQRRANKVIQHIYQHDKKIVLIGVGGIDSAKSAWQRISSGASLIQIYTGWIFRGPQLVPHILEGLIKQMNIYSLSNIKDAIGSGLEWQD